MAAFNASARSLDAGHRRGARRARRPRARRGHAGHLHHRPRPGLPGREGDPHRPRDRRLPDPARPGRVHRRAGQRRAGVADRPLPDGLRAARDRPARTGSRASRCCRSSRGAAPVRDEVFAEGTYHAAYEPQRAIRTERWKYIRRFDDRDDAGAPQHRRRPGEGPLDAARVGRATGGEGALYDLVFDPEEMQQPGRRPRAGRRGGRAARAARGVDARHRRPPPRRARPAAAGRRVQRAGPDLARGSPPAAPRPWAHRSADARRALRAGHARRARRARRPVPDPRDRRGHAAGARGEAADERAHQGPAGGCPSPRTRSATAGRSPGGRASAGGRSRRSW